MIKLKPINKPQTIRYVCYSLMILVMAFARTREGLSPFNLGMLTAFFYSGQNMLILAPVYFAASVLAEPTLRGLIVSVAPPLIFLAVWFLHKVTNRRVKLVYAMVYAALSLIPQLVYGVNGLSDLITALGTVLLAQIFAYIASITAYAILVKGKRYKFATDELVGIYAVITVCAMGINSFDIFGFKPFYVVAPFIIMLTVFIGGMNAIFTPLALGIGAGAFDGNLGVAAGLLVSGVFALIFIKNNIYLSSIAFLLGDLLAGLFFNAYGAYSYLHIIAVAVGLTAFAVIPKNTRINIVARFSVGEASTVRAVLKRSREDNSDKLLSIANVFDEIAAQLYGAKYIEVDSDKIDRRLAEEVEIAVCAKCKEYGKCSQAMGGQASLAYEQIVTIARAREASAHDVSPFLSSRCCNVCALLSEINAKASAYNEYIQKSGQISMSRIIVAEQMRGLAEILSGLSGALNTPVSFDSEREKRIADELRYAHIVTREILCESMAGWRIIVVVRAVDADNEQLVKCVESVIKCPLEIVRTARTEIQGYVSVELRDRTKFEIEVGVSTATKDGSVASGDTYSCGSIGGGKYIVAISDGMGSGSVAHYNSASTISMIENYYKAGFDNNIILTLINRILAEFNRESFTCLDMAVVDLNSGIFDFIKLGGVESVVRVGDVVETISSGALPMGIVDEAEPVTVRRALTNGDIVVLMSDGVSDALGIEGVKDILRVKNNLSMKELSAYILDSATRDGAMDDTTVICSRLYRAVSAIR